MGLEVPGSLTRERWEIVRGVLEGEDESGVSERYAASKAGIKRGELRRWVEYSREQPDDAEPWVLEIAGIYDGAFGSQAQTLADAVWERAVKGNVRPVIHKGEVVGGYREADNGLTMRLLEARDKRYCKTTKQESVHRFEINELFRKFQASNRLEHAEVHGRVAALEAARGGEVIEGSAVEVEVSGDSVEQEGVLGGEW